MPRCDTIKAIRDVTGELVRTQTTRVSGLSNVAQVSADGHGGWACSATVNLDFGSRPVTYAIRRLVPGKKTWEMSLTGP